MAQLKRLRVQELIRREIKFLFAPITKVLGGDRFRLHSICTYDDTGVRDFYDQMITNLIELVMSAANFVGPDQALAQFGVENIETEATCRVTVCIFMYKAGLVLAESTGDGSVRGRCSKVRAPASPAVTKAWRDDSVILSG